MMEPADGNTMTVEELDRLGVIEAQFHDDVEIVDAFVDKNAPHGSNDESEMVPSGLITRVRSFVGGVRTRLSTSQLRKVWNPPCRGPWARVSLYGSGKVTVRPTIAEAVRALNACLIAFKYLTRAGDTGAYNCRRITNGILMSLHAFAIALDINWLDNPYGRRLITNMPPAMRAAIKAIRTKSGAQVWGWGGDYTGNKDAMHYEIVCTPADLASGIDWSTVPGAAPAVNDEAKIKFVETMLNMLRVAGGKPQIKVDGKLDNETKAAIKEFQRDANAMGHKPPLALSEIPDDATCKAIGDWVNLILAAKAK